MSLRYNDRGNIDTEVKIQYCGTERLDMLKLTSQLSPVKDRAAYSEAVRALPRPVCERE